MPFNQLHLIRQRRWNRRPVEPEALHAVMDMRGEEDEKRERDHRGSCQLLGRGTRARATGEQGSAAAEQLGSERHRRCRSRWEARGAETMAI